MTEPEKLKHLLKHWIEHNDAHVKTLTVLSSLSGIQPPLRHQVRI